MSEPVQSGLSLQTLEPASGLRLQYLRARDRHFPRLRLSDETADKELVVLRGGMPVGGVALHRHRDAALDRDLQAHWQLHVSWSGIRISQLWTDGRGSTLRRLLRGVAASLATENQTLLYGIQSLSLRRARRWQSLIDVATPWATPRSPLADAAWDPEDLPSSDGDRLFAAYVRMGVAVLGGAAVDPFSRSVRVLIGLPLRDLTRHVSERQP